jgi:hypothetical protein
MLFLAYNRVRRTRLYDIIRPALRAVSGEKLLKYAGQISRLIQGAQGHGGAGHHAQAGDAHGLKGDHA